MIFNKTLHLNDSNKNTYFQSVILGLVSFFTIYWYGGRTSGDDTFIYMRYVENFINGNGFVYNIGEKSFGTTSLLWAYLMIPLAYIFNNSILLWKLVSTLLIALRISILFAFFKHIKLSLNKSLLLTLFCSLDIHLIRWSSSGMENSLAILSLTITILLFHLLIHNDYTFKKHQNVFLIVLSFLIGLLPSIRPELALYTIGIVLIFLFDRSLKVYFSKIIIIVVLVVLIGLFSNLIAFHSIIPQTAEAKAIMLHQSFNYAVRQSFLILLSGSAGGLITLHMVRNITVESKKIIILILFSVFTTLIYLSVVGQLISTRYSVFLASPILLAATLIISEYFLIQKKSFSIRLSFATQLILTLSLAVLFFPITRVSEEDDIKKVVQYAVGTLPKNSRVAISEIGIYGFYSKHYIIDLFGLTDKETLKWAKLNGKVDSQVKLEDILTFRNATHYIFCFGRDELIKGEQLNFKLLAKFPVRRNNFSKLEVSSDYWQIYELTKNNSIGN